MVEVLFAVETDGLASSNVEFVESVVVSADSVMSVESDVAKAYGE